MNPLHQAGALFLAIFAGAVLAADPDLARNLAATCANCHGTDGKALAGTAIKPLAGVDQASLLQKLADFKSGAQSATIMHQIVKGYSQEQLELITGYFAVQR